ncbi:MAG: TadE/TadG family type IV pilus assembly protein [Vicinamibacterales bacterium]
MTSESYGVLRYEILRQIWPLAVGLLVSTLMTVAIGRFAIARLKWSGLRSLGTHGTSEMEFTLALPVFLTSALTTVQLALMLNASLVVDYAAYCAARSAAVWVPQDLPDEPADIIADPNDDDGSEKWTRIRRAATLAVTPISPRLSRFRFGFSQPPSGDPVDGAALARLASAGTDSLGRLPNLAQLGVVVVDKWLYAALFTDVALEGTDGEPVVDFSTTPTVTARVTHKFEMAVPLAGALIGAAVGERYLWLVGGYYVSLSASYTLVRARS